MMRSSGAILGGLVLVVAAMAMADVSSPTGFGKAKFGASVEEVKKLYPDMRELSFTENLGSVPVGGPYIKRFVITKQKVEGLEKPVDVELRFWKEKFWLFVVYLGENDTDSAVKMLTKSYGPVTNTDARFPIWNLPKATILVEMKKKMYTVNDEELSKDARAWFIEMLRSRRAPDALQMNPPAANAAPAASPQPTPASTTPAAGAKP